ncbi:hypothetical protein VitviT2T_022960 [Vitis vinifera]|uniref:Uncharacterized protein n=1 Tax=Vitis vinifera TaxID=29760 RepID=A0ABY9DDB0_VITVI|nr:hypothetical protein VitviT2T_022960 [Vitis vinifera]
MKSFILLFLENYWVRKLEVVFAVVIATMVLSFIGMFGRLTLKVQVQEALKWYSNESPIVLLISLVINFFVTIVFEKGFYGNK